VPFGGAVQCRLQGVGIGHVDVASVDAFLGQQRRELAHGLLAEARRELNLRWSRRWFGGAAAHVGHEAIFPGRRWQPCG
jgi:hypothetical protein